MATSDARVVLLGRLIDHAPLFPPASLPLAEAVEEDRRARESESAYVLGRFVCPASLLAELPDVGRGLSVVLDAPLLPDPRVEAVEARPSFDPGSDVPDAGEIYVETHLDEGLPGRLAVLVEHGLGAKVRCGGASVPSVEALGGFVRACRERDLPFKATAGLHHALPTNGEHGFLNLLAAVVFGDEEAALAEDDGGAFVLDADSFRWRDRTARTPELEQARRRFRSIGSCSFFEPVEELESLGMLPP